MESQADKASLDCGDRRCTFGRQVMAWVERWGDFQPRERREPLSVLVLVLVLVLALALALALAF